MSLLTIGTTTVETAEIISFEFDLHELGPEPDAVEHIALHANLQDGSSAATEGDEAVTLKVLLASIGLVDLHTASACRSQYPPESLEAL
ncbi:MAG: hypothetical protein EOP86_07560 [Verrucomicrobiaceae bacterium]|nr:MAG: hypothetical protein EOP86_07560 [Verrucomicrobiaceae bacterium]